MLLRHSLSILVRRVAEELSNQTLSPHHKKHFQFITSNCKNDHSDKQDTDERMGIYIYIFFWICIHIHAQNASRQCVCRSVFHWHCSGDTVKHGTVWNDVNIESTGNLWQVCLRTWQQLPSSTDTWLGPNLRSCNSEIWSIITVIPQDIGQTKHFLGDWGQ